MKIEITTGDRRQTRLERAIMGTAPEPAELWVNGKQAGAVLFDSFWSRDGQTCVTLRVARPMTGKQRAKYVDANLRRLRRGLKP